MEHLLPSRRFCRDRIFSSPRNHEKIYLSLRRYTKSAGMQMPAFFKHEFCESQFSVRMMARHLPRRAFSVGTTEMGGVSVVTSAYAGHVAAFGVSFNTGSRHERVSGVRNSQISEIFASVPKKSSESGRSVPGPSEACREKSDDAWRKNPRRN